MTDRPTDRTFLNRAAGLLAFAGTSLFSMAAMAQDAAEYGIRQPEPLNTRFQEPATAIMREVAWFEGYTLAFLLPIGIFVGGLLAYVIWKFNHNKHPVASRTSHNTTIEVVWTVAPVLILLFLAVPSFQLLTAQFDPPGEPELTVKATGYQWYWGYEYQNDEDGAALVSFDALPLLQDKDRDTFGKTDLGLYPALLVTDNEFVVPVDTVVRLLVTGGDVIHSWAMPSFGKKMDAIPGRLNETWFKVEEEGIYYGQCSELCGKDHAFMPIAVRVVSRPEFDTWLEVAASGDLDGANRTLIDGIDARRLARTEAIEAEVSAADPDTIDAGVVTPVAN